MRLAIGEMHTLLFESQNVNGQKIIFAGFEFQYKSIQSALVQLLGK